MIKNLLECNKDAGIALALGYFDAVHIGHQSVFDSVKNKCGSIPSVFTFANNIYELLGREVMEIYTFEERCRIIGSYGIENIYYLKATPEILNMRGEAFLDLLNSRLNIRLIAAGMDYTYGVSAENDTQTLKNYCSALDIKCIIKPLLYRSGMKVSSTGIRAKLLEGDMEYVTNALGRPYSVTGTVVEGRKNGRELGFPTINMVLPHKILQPKRGVYSSRATIGKITYRGVTNIGAHPTFEDFSDNIETHLIGFKGDLYGQTVTLELMNYIRDIRRFESRDMLKTHIAADVERVNKEEL
jgi:riboflavin kinase/FMN adenylyltransferase